MSQTYLVDGMTCGGCARSVAGAITRAAPDAKVEVDQPTGRVTVSGAIAEETVQKAVEGAGFDYRGKAA